MYFKKGEIAMIRIKKDLCGREAVIFDPKKIVKIEETGYCRTNILFEDGSKIETRNTLDEIMEQIEEHEKKKEEVSNSLWEILLKGFELN